MPKQMAATPNLDRLNAFMGVWETKGEMKIGPTGRPVKFKATDTFEWLPGGHFLLHRFDADMPDGNVKGIEVIGYNQESNVYSMHTFDSLGNASVMRAQINGDTWTFTGENVRFTGGFRDNGMVFMGHWENACLIQRSQRKSA